MKTLDEVITALGICQNVDPYHVCRECPYPDGQGCMNLLMSDALHYLKEYKAKQDEDFRQAYIAVRNEMLFGAEDINDPLTWEQLKQMEGKPVWYEHEFWKGWIILGKVEQGVNCEMIPDREERWYIVKDGSAKAYRKERE